MIFTLFCKDIFGQVIKPIQSTSNTRLQHFAWPDQNTSTPYESCLVSNIKKQLSALQAWSIRASSLCVFRHQCEALLFYQIKRFNRKECYTHHIHAHTLTIPKYAQPKASAFKPPDCITRFWATCKPQQRRGWQHEDFDWIINQLKHCRAREAGGFHMCLKSTEAAGSSQLKSAREMKQRVWWLTAPFFGRE